MAVRLIDGVPGGGKTYYAVRHLAKTYFRKNDEGFYEIDKPCVIVTNIDGFKPAHLKLSDEINKAGGDLRVFFSEEYQKKFTEQQSDQIVYVIDEAQKLFRKNDRTLNDVFSYFEYHRHFGHDIYLITQNVKKIHTDITLLAEYVISATPRVRSLAGEFKYNWFSGGEKLKREVFKPDKGVFALYKSMDKSESEKISNPIMKTVGIVMVAAFLVVGGGYWWFKGKWGQSNEPKSSSVAAVNSVQSNPGGNFHSAQMRPLTPQTKTVHISSLCTYSGDKAEVRLVWDGFLYTIGDFPYTLSVRSNSWFADIPLTDLPDKGRAEEKRSSVGVRAENEAT